MTESDPFLSRVIAARTAAWWILLIGVAIQMFVYVAYLGMGKGWLDGLIAAGAYGELTRHELAYSVFAYIAVLKLINHVILLGALFLTLWVRGLRKTLNPSPDA
jgi:hypothetical protein